MSVPLAQWESSGLRKIQVRKITGSIPSAVHGFGPLSLKVFSVFRQNLDEVIKMSRQYKKKINFLRKQGGGKIKILYILESKRI